MVADLTAWLPAPIVNTLLFIGNFLLKMHSLSVSVLPFACIAFGYQR
jgi:hypothetical protein